mgnify:CR=1 FL=1
MNLVVIDIILLSSSKKIRFSSCIKFNTNFTKDILYIERDTYERKLIIKTKNNSFKVSLTKEQMLASLDKRFKQVHRACIVNTNEVLSYYWGQGYFILKNGTEVPLCSRNYKDH